MKIKNILVAGISFALLTNFTFASVENANYLSWKWIIVNKSANPSEYRLKNNILRQEAAVIALWVYWWNKLDYCSWIFRDVYNTPKNSWACGTIEALAKYDVISDDNLYFHPLRNITKAEVIGMLVEAWFDDEYDYKRGFWSWQEQVVNFASSKWIVKNFYDYNSLATREFVFEVWANILKYKNWENMNVMNNNSNNFNNSTSPRIDNSQNRISSQQAKNIALKNSWLSENQIFGFRMENDYEYGKLFYEIEFFQNNSRKKFEYKIDSTNWQIVEFDVDFD